MSGTHSKEDNCQCVLVRKDFHRSKKLQDNKELPGTDYNTGLYRIFDYWRNKICKNANYSTPIQLAYRPPEGYKESYGRCFQEKIDDKTLFC